MNTLSEDYDAVIVGARCAGSATAMLLARAGRRVLQLDRWGVLPQIIAAGTPAVTATTFHYGDRADTINPDTINPDTINPDTINHAALFAPRRTVLDTVLLGAAQQAGADTRFGVEVTGLSRDRDGTVTGLMARTRTGDLLRVRAPITIGADGRRSTVARLAGAATVHQGHAAGAVIYGYWPNPAAHRYEWFYRPGATGGIIPTNYDEVCIWVGMPAARFADERARGLGQLFHDVLAYVAPAAADIVAPVDRTGPLRGFPGVPGFLRRAAGPGWALVGDAGYFKDPLTAHGITDALRDAEFLARAVVDGGPDALARYEQHRDRLSLPLFEVTEAIAAYRWDVSQIQRLLLALSVAMKPEVAALRALDILPSAVAAA
jgi:flavin-dependent dehydrogenase